MGNYEDWREPFEVFGSWKLSRSEDRFGGLLKWDPATGAELLLAGGSPAAHEAWWGEHKVIAGHAEGRVFNVLRPFATSGRMAPTGSLDGRFSANSVLVGSSVLTEADPKVKAIQIDLPPLGDLLSAIEFRERQEGDNSQLVASSRTSSNHRVANETPIDGVTMTLIGRRNHRASSGRDKPVRESFGTAHVKYEKSVRLEQIQERIALDFVSLLTNHATTPGPVSIFVDNTDQHVTTPTVEYFLIEPFRRERKRGNDYGPTVTLTSMDELATVLSGWLSAYEDLRSVVDLRVADLFDPSQYAENRFLNAAQSLEGLHRRSATFSQTDEKSVAMRDEAIRSTANNAQLSEWLAETLEYVDQPTLSFRLKEMIFELKQMGMTISSKDRGRLTGRVVELRNGLAHHTPGANEGWNAWELGFLGELLDAFVDVLLFVRFGAEPATTQKAASEINVRSVLDRIEKFKPGGSDH